MLLAQGNQMPVSTTRLYPVDEDEDEDEGYTCSALISARYRQGGFMYSENGSRSAKQA